MRASSEFIKSTFKYAFLGLYNFSILIIIGLFFISTNIFSRTLLHNYTPWKLPASQFNLRLLRNYAPYLAEGKGGLSLLINENVSQLYSIWGQPIRRDYASTERLYYKTNTFRGSFLVYKSRIIGIRYEVNTNYNKINPFITAFQIRYENIINKTKKNIIDFILKRYQHPPHIKTNDVLYIFSRGISFTFEKNKLLYIDIFAPTKRTW